MAERHELGRQESLFEGLAPPRPNPWARPPDAPAGDDKAAEPAREAAPSSDELVRDAPQDGVLDSPDPRALRDAPAREPRAPHDEPVQPPETLAGDIVIERRTEPVHELPAGRSYGAALAGPTLDDVVSRVWEGLATGLPAACPLCHGEVVPALGGSLSGTCTSCGMSID